MHAHHHLGVAADMNLLGCGGGSCRERKGEEKGPTDEPDELLTMPLSNPMARIAVLHGKKSHMVALVVVVD
jgi:hypothetical protein